MVSNEDPDSDSGSDARPGWRQDASPTPSSTTPTNGSQTSLLPQQQRWTSATATLSWIRNRTAHWGKMNGPELMGELICLVCSATIGTATLIGFLYFFIFVLQPGSARQVASGSFIEQYPLDADGHPTDGLARWTEDFSRSVVPIMCHSHNDYWRAYPLYSALAAGCTGVEADVYLSEDGTDLLVGHDEKDLSPDKTLRSLYLDPLYDILTSINPPEKWSNFSRTDRAEGVFRSGPNVTLVLLLDVKTDAHTTWPVVMQQLQKLRDKMFLFRYEAIETSPGFELKQRLWPGPITVVGTGDLVEKRRANNWPDSPSYWRYHDAFLDAPLGRLPDENVKTIYEDGWGASVMWDKEDAYYTSVSFKEAIGSVRTGFSKRQMEKLRTQIQTARWSGLKTRYWDLPSWPISYRDYIWRVLTEEGVDMLNIDDLKSASKRSWTVGYVRSVAWMVTVSIFIFLASVALTWCSYRGMKRQADRLAAPRPIMLQ